MKSTFVLKNAKGEVVADLGRGKPSLRTLARDYGRRCRKEGLAVHRRDFQPIADGAWSECDTLIGALHREESKTAG